MRARSSSCSARIPWTPTNGALLMFEQLGVIGCGLMGGSFALAMKRAGLVKHVVGYSKSPSTVIQAQKLGVVDQAAEPYAPPERNPTEIPRSRPARWHGASQATDAP